MVNVFDADATALASELTAAGVANVTLDPRGQLPCVLVELPYLPPGDQGVGGWPVDQRVHVIAPPPGDLAARTWLLDQLEVIKIAYPGIEAEPTTITRNDTDCPAYVVRLTRSIDNPSC